MSNYDLLLEKLISKRQTLVNALKDPEARGAWHSIINKYASEAHFVNELLQNADDCNASYAIFDLQSEGLYFRHNGTTKFTLSDVSNAQADIDNGTLGHINAITGIGNTSKADQQKIGKFGIGFKAVFVYTATPQIYDENISLEIYDYIVPRKIRPTSYNFEKDETLFYFPFNSDLREKEDAYNEISHKLKSINNSLLFLNNLKEISWHTIDERGSYKKRLYTSEILDKKSNILSENIYVTTIVNTTRETTKFRIFSTLVSSSENSFNHKICIGFKLDENDHLDPGLSNTAFCFFPTLENTYQKFILHAPFLLTDDRENLLPNEKWNDYIISQLTILSKKAFLSLRDEDIKMKKSELATHFSNYIPSNLQIFKNQSTGDISKFIAFFHSFEQLLNEEKILPGRNSTFFDYEHAYWPQDKNILSIFSDKQISELMKNPNSGFVFSESHQPDFSQINYLKTKTLEVLTPEKLLRAITPEFIEKQSIEWLHKLYEFISSNENYIKIAREVPIVLSSSNKAIVPYDKHRSVYRVFLPDDNIPGFETINPILLKNDTTLEFFKKLGLTKPNSKTFYLTKVLPIYQDNVDFLLEEEIKTHTNLLINFYIEATAEETSNFFFKVAELPLVRVRKNTNKREPSLKPVCFSYISSDLLTTYFQGYEHAYFLDEDFYHSFLNDEDYSVFLRILQNLHINKIPRVIISYREIGPSELDHFDLSGFKSCRNTKITDKTLDGLNNALRNCTFEKSLLIWNYLLELVGDSGANISKYFNAAFEYKPSGQGRHQLKSKIVNSSFYIALVKQRWIFDKNENRHTSSEILQDDINSGYNLSHKNAPILLEKLNIKNEIEAPELNDTQQEIYDKGKFLHDLGFSKDEILELAERLKAEKEIKIVKEQPAEKLFDIEPLPEDKPVVAEKKKNVIKTLKNLQQDLFDNFPNDLENNTKIVTPRFVTNDEDLPDSTGDFNPPINLEEEYQKRIAEVQREIEELANVESLKNQVIENEKYSYGWFKALMQLEHLKGTEENSSGKEVTITFEEAFLESSDGRILVLKKPNRYIPHDLEDQPDITLKINEDGKTHQLSVEVVNVQEYTIKAKVRRKDDLRKINFNKVKNVVIDIKNPIFLLDELKKNIDNLSLKDDYNLKKNITDKIKFIFGPPGTGKTTYLATDEIIPLMKQKEYAKVLVLTPTNKAADVLTTRIMEKMGEDHSYQDWLIRFGTTSETKITDDLDENFKNIDIEGYDKAVVISTIARFSYDYFQKMGSSHRENIRHFPWDYIIIDEASMITLPNMVNVFYSQPQADFIIAGDPFQITPISKVQEWKDENIYTMVNLLSFTEPQTEPHHFEIVNRYTQYRSLPSIGQIFSIFSYDGKLLHHRTADTKQIITISGMDLKDLNVIKFPVKKNQSIFSPNSLNGSKYHIYSALFSVEMAMKFAEEIAPQVEDTFRIGIICPYRAQANIIEKVLAQQHINNTKVEIVVGTIHGFQGDECNMIITVFNPPYKITGGPDMFLNKQNILNVAISRARDYLVILMPDDKTQDIGKLQKVKQIANLCLAYGKENYAEFSSTELEKKLFGSNSYIFDNSFATKHQEVNVYSDPVKKYEVRCEEKAVDVQIK